ncbi:CBS domain-containing protein [Bacillus sp. FJAT-27225]|uniref:CBS domain-containing protein n=1 Tax=Bacillus sp. FJAT-27225 TaxID=1743144 RepID=UPI00080C3408|nr:CBS domain-containing protein [Bacillus sp. FJAT-27225]OCA81591.1 CBS domain-containing protein [Bacillus sp. FJAT-27225]
MNIKDVMTTEVETCAPDASLFEVAKKMRELDVGVIPICDGEQLVGLATDRDLVIHGLANNLSTDTPISEVMTKDPVRGTVEMSAEEAADLMADVQIRRLPIVEQGRLIGIVSLGDLAVEDQSSDDAGQALEEISNPSEPEK